MSIRPVVRRGTEGTTERWSDERGMLEFTTMIGDGTPTNELTAGTCRIRPQSSLHKHSHAASEIYYILSGSGVVHLAGTEHDVEAGDMVFIPSHSVHGITNPGTVDLEFVFTYAADSLEDERTKYA